MLELSDGPFGERAVSQGGTTVGSEIKVRAQFSEVLLATPFSVCCLDRFSAGERESLCNVMGRRSRLQRHLHYARERKRQKQEAVREPTTDQFDSTSSKEDNVYYLSSDLDENELADCEAAFIKWNKDVDMRKFRSVYYGDSRTTVWRRKQEAKKLQNSLRGFPKITTFFGKSVAEQDAGDVEDVGTHMEEDGDFEDESDDEDQEIASDQDNDVTQCDPLSIESALVELSKFTKFTCDAREASRMAGVSKFDFMRYMAVESYLRLQLPSNGLRMMAASRQVVSRNHMDLQNDSIS
jgi:hypothetical protein